MPIGVASDAVPVQTIQAAVKAMDITKSELCRRMGWVEVKPDLAQVNRRLGLAVSNGTRAQRQQYVRYETAVQMIRAMGLDPVDYGL